LYNVWVGTDWHLWSEDINDPRHPYRSVSNLGRLSDNYAQDIQDDDIFIYLGDLCDPGVTDPRKLTAIVSSIPGRKILVKGNHDTQDDCYYLEAGFDDVCDICVLGNLIFSHKPIIVAPDEINIHGHIHTAKLSMLGSNHINAYNCNFGDHPLNVEDMLERAPSQKLEEYKDTYSPRIDKLFTKYMSVEGDHYKKILDITDCIPLYPVDEAATDSGVLKEIYDFNVWMDKTFQYGLVVNGKPDLKNDDYDTYYVAQSPKEFEKSKTGVCWDYVSYEAWYFAKHFPQVKTKTYYIQFFNGEDCPSHTILTFVWNGKHYYFENSFRRFAGLYEAKSENDIINYVLKLMSDNPDPSIQKGELLKKWEYDAWEYNALDHMLFGIRCQEYMNYVTDNGKCLHHTYSAPHSVKKVSGRNINETTGILDEILFQDTDDTKYWEEDDERYIELVRKADDAAKSNVAIDESWMVIQDDLRINMDEWGPGNPLWVTGSSGDGKSTLVEQLAAETGAEIVTADILLCRMGWTKEKFDALCQGDIVSGASAHKMHIDASPAMDYVISHPELPWMAKDPKTKHFINEITDPEMIKFFTWFMEESATNPKYKDRTFIIEGCDICLLDPNIMATKPLIIIGGSRLRSFIRRAKRDIDKKGHNTSEAIFKYIKKYNTQNRRLDDAKDNFRDAIDKIINTSGRSLSEVAKNDRGYTSPELDDYKVSTIQAIADRIHRDYENDKRPESGNQNCQICTWAFELQCRGETIFPRPVYSPRDIIFTIDGPDIVIGSMKEVFSSRKDMIRIINKAGVGSRFYVHVNWKNSSGGHEFVVMSIPSGIYLVDPQDGLVCKIDDKKADPYFKINYVNSYMVRMDDKKINYNVVKYNQSRYLTQWDEVTDIQYMKDHNILSESAVSQNNIWYHMVPKGTDVSKGIVSPSYMKAAGMDDVLHESLDKYRDRLVSSWSIYPGRTPESLTDDEILDGLDKFRGADGSKSIYLFRYPPSKLLGPNMAKVLASKDIYEVDLDKVPDLVKLDFTVNDGPGEKYFNTIRPTEYFSTYDDNAEKHGKLLFAGIPHVAIVTRSGRIPPSAIRKVADFTLYHGSPDKHAILKPRTNPAYPTEKAVYGTSLYECALAFAGGNWTDLEINQSMYNGTHVLTEIMPGMFDRVFDRSGYVHYMHSTGFYNLDRSTEYISLWDVKPYKIEKIDNVLLALERSGTQLYCYPDLPPFIPDRNTYIRNVCEKFHIDAAAYTTLGESSSTITTPAVLNEMAYEDAQEFMLAKLKHYCQEFNNQEKYFVEISKKWKKENPDAGDPPKLNPELKYGTDNQLFFLLNELNTDNATVNQIGSYWNLVKALVDTMNKDSEVKSFKYVTRVSAEAEDVVGVYVDLMGIGASHADDPEVSWPAVKAHIDERIPFHDDMDTTLTYYNDKGAEVGHASIRSNGYIHHMEVSPRYRGKNYGNAMMRHLMKEYKVTEFTVENGNQPMLAICRKFGFEACDEFCDWHANTLVMRLRDDAGKINEDTAFTSHEIDPDDKKRLMDKYDLKTPGQSHDYYQTELNKPKETDAQQRLRERREKRLKALKKARRVKRHKAFVRKVKSHLPKGNNTKNEEVETDPLWGDQERFFEPPDHYSELAESYRFEMLDTVKFIDPVINESVIDRGPLKPVYVILWHTGTVLSSVIKSVVKSEYSHTSISFDPSMRRMYSFGRKNANVEGLKSTGFAIEDIRSDFYKNRKVHYGIFVVPCFQDEIDNMKRRLDYFIKNATKFAYDIPGLVKNFFGIEDNQEHAWFCSRFVADILNAGRPDKPYMPRPSLVRPDDFKTTSFAWFVDGGDDAAKYEQSVVEKKTRAILRKENLALKKQKKQLSESVVYDIDPLDLFYESVLNYKLATLDDNAFNEFLIYLQSFKVKFDNNGNVIISRREVDQLEQRFRQTVREAKAFQNAGNIEGMKECLAQVYFMIELINKHYLNPKAMQSSRVKADIKKEMLDLRSVMLNMFQQNLKWVTIQDPQFNFKSYYDSSKYGKDTYIPKTVLTALGKTIVTALR